MINQETIDRVQRAADIVEVVRESCPDLKKAGQDWVCCCPFHGERTPSFHVNQVRQTWHCFGQCQDGGDVIAFVMKRDGKTFPEAVKALAARYGIEVDEEAEDEDDRQKRLRREAMVGLNERVADMYRSLLMAETDASRSALQYAVQRWGFDYVREAGIGYAPEAWDTLAGWARRMGESQELLIDLGLLKRNEEKGRIYDFMRGRLVIPIRDRQGKTIGFTARDLTEGSTQAKYVNSMESEVYHKGETVFGMNEAWSQAGKEGRLYLVEGAPDAMKMHSVGINNVVATLGGNWTKDQLLSLKRLSENVCFINDADPVPQGERYGTGIKYVLRNGEMAMRLGLNVTVRELPCKEGNLKQDPGDFFQTKARINELREEDFVLWAAQKIVDKDAPTDRQSAQLKQVATIASYIQDDTLLEMMIDGLNKVRRGKEFWRSLIQKARWDREKDQKKRSGEIDLREYGFYKEGGGYWGQTDKGNDFQWSNFTLRPVFHIKDAEAPKRIFYIKNNRGQEDVLEMQIEDLVSLTRFRQALESIGNYMWMAGDRELMKLKTYLYEQTETSSLIKQMGWNAAGFYAWGNGIWQDGQFHKADEFGVCRLAGGQNWYIPAASKLHRDDKKKYERERKFIHQTLQNVPLRRYLEDFIMVYGNNGIVGLCYWLASLFRDVVTDGTRSFPILNLFGPKGSGKTELGAALMAFFISDNKAPNLRNSTATALNDDVAFASNALVHLDEYKNDIRPDKIEFLKGLYDGVGRVKMSGAAFDARIMTSVKSGVIMSGQEMPTADPALFSRCVFLSFPRSEFSAEEVRRFGALREKQKFGLSFLTLQVLQHRKYFEAHFMETYSEVRSEVDRETDYARLDTRIVENWCKILSAMRVLQAKIDLPFSYEEVKGLCITGLKTQCDILSTGNELATFWSAVAFLKSTGEIFSTADYRITTTKTLRTVRRDYDFEQPTRLLLLNKSRVFSLYKRACLQTGESALPEDSLKIYLENSDYYLGTARSVRFKQIIKGIKQVTVTNDGRTRDKEQVLHAMVFRYDRIAERYGIDLEDQLGEIVQ